MRTHILCAIAIFVLGGAWLTTAVEVSAQTSATRDPRCFTQEACTSARNGVPEGFYQSNETKKVCNSDEYGYCLPSGETFAGIKIGGKDSFTSLGDYIQYIYQFAVIAIAVIAVSMIVTAGLQWSASAGNPQIIAGAKKRIGNAVAGIVLSVGAVTVLQTINPYLANFRLPQVWMINNDTGLASEYCANLPLVEGNAPKVHAATVPPEQITQASPGTISAYSVEKVTSNGNTFIRKTEQTSCGQSYYVLNEYGSATTNSCLGLSCPNGQVCLDNSCQTLTSKEGGIVGRITPSLQGKYVDALYVFVQCSSGPEQIWSTSSLGSGSTFYLADALHPEATNACGGEEHILGYFFEVEVNDTSFGATVDDSWIGGTTMCAQSPLSASAYSCGVVGKNELVGQIEDDIVGPFANLMAANKLGELIPPNNVKQGLLCNLTLDDRAMPDLGPSFIQASLLSLSRVLAPSEQEQTFIDNYIGGKNLVIGGAGYNCPPVQNQLNKHATEIKQAIREIQN